MAKIKTPYPHILGGSLKIDISLFAAKMIDDHTSLIAQGYTLTSPVTVVVRQDGKASIPFRYRRRSGEDGVMWDRYGWTVTAYVGGLFGVWRDDHG